MMDAMSRVLELLIKSGKKDPINVNVYDFKDKELGKVNPYGVYDIANNEGWVNVGTDHDTASFAVESICRWWNTSKWN
ncbi:Mobile element protein [Methanosarcina siciliae HI350]|uniref:Mobile element protein n=1 Tax=Methanosarcina siciliae HI350 TaxID=1434119 RepID=A0A0E3PEL2_9EURY|nr:Mobile element protein [Methanosarcina siciliae HI350]